MSLNTKFGSREVCDVVFRATAAQKIGNRQFYRNEPVLYFDTLKTSTLEGAATTVYATGGKGNPNLIGWDGDRTMTFTMEDALISALGFSILSGAGLVEATKGEPIYQHMSETFEVTEVGKVTIPYNNVVWNGGRVTPVEVAAEHKHVEADIYVIQLDANNVPISENLVPAGATFEGDTCVLSGIAFPGDEGTCVDAPVGSYVLVDFYIKREAGAYQIEIEASKFGGYFYIEGSTLFRRETDGMDMPAEFIIPRGKVQSNFSFSMTNTGDPSTFTFTVDAFPGYLKFDKSKQVLAVIQVIEDESGITEADRDNGCQDGTSKLNLNGGFKVNTTSSLYED